MFRKLITLTLFGPVSNWGCWFCCGNSTNKAPTSTTVEEQQTVDITPQEVSPGLTQPQQLIYKSLESNQPLPASFSRIEEIRPAALFTDGTCNKIVKNLSEAENMLYLVRVKPGGKVFEGKRYYTLWNRTGKYWTEDVEHSNYYGNIFSSQTHTERVMLRFKSGVDNWLSSQKTA